MQSGPQKWTKGEVINNLQNNTTETTAVLTGVHLYPKHYRTELWWNLLFSCSFLSVCESIWARHRHPQICVRQQNNVNVGHLGSPVSVLSGAAPEQNGQKSVQTQFISLVRYFHAKAERIQKPADESPGSLTFPFLLLHHSLSLFRYLDYID